MLIELRHTQWSKSLRRDGVCRPSSKTHAGMALQKTEPGYRAGNFQIIPFVFPDEAVTTFPFETTREIRFGRNILPNVQMDVQMNFDRLKF